MTEADNRQFLDAVLYRYVTIAGCHGAISLLTLEVGTIPTDGSADGPNVACGTGYGRGWRLMLTTNT